MKTHYSVFILAFLLFWGSFTNIFAQRSMKTLSISDSFSGINLSISANVFLSQAETQVVKADIDDKDFEAIEFIVKDNVLTIKSKSWKSSFDDIKIYISIPEIQKLTINSSGTIKSETDIRTEDLCLVINGSGDIILNNVVATNLDTQVNGSGDIRVKGDGKNLKSCVNGSGRISCKDYATDFSNINISGSGDVYIKASNELNVKISGSGSVYYLGNPSVNCKINGSGQINQL